MMTSAGPPVVDPTSNLVWFEHAQDEGSLRLHSFGDEVVGLPVQRHAVGSGRSKTTNSWGRACPCSHLGPVAHSATTNTYEGIHP
jgi:hypothetical protein